MIHNQTRLRLRCSLRLLSPLVFVSPCADVIFSLLEKYALPMSLLCLGNVEIVWRKHEHEGLQLLLRGLETNHAIVTVISPRPRVASQ